MPKIPLLGIVAGVMLWCLAISPGLAADEEDQQVTMNLYLMQPQVKVGEQAAFIIRIANNSEHELEKVTLLFENRGAQFNLAPVDSSIAPNSSFVSYNTAVFQQAGRVTIIPVLKYTTIVTPSGAAYVPASLPMLEVVEATRPNSSFLSQAGSVLLGVIITLVTVGCTSLVNDLTQRRRQRLDTREMLSAAITATLDVATSGVGQVPADTFKMISSSPHFERILALVERAKRRHAFKQRFSSKPPVPASMTELPKRLIEANQEVQHYSQVYTTQGGHINQASRDALKQKVEGLQTLLREL
jgi:hypothetical protein